VRTVDLLVMPTCVGMTDRARFVRQLPQQLLGVA
jgi:hypothetical protein